MTEAIAPALARRLDRFAVPPLPEGFAERTIARALALPGEVGTPATPPLPPLRAAPPRRRWRSVGMGLGMIAAGMVSISAAASGYFGEPIRHAIVQTPVIGAVIERVMTRPVRKREKTAIAAKPEAPAIEEPAPASEPAQTAVSSKAPALTAPAVLPPRLRDLTPEQRQAWLAGHPRMAERLARRQAWIESHPGAAARIAERQEQRRAAVAAGQTPREERIRRRFERRAALRDAFGADAGDAGPVVAPGASDGPQPGPTRPYRAERLRRLQERLERRRLRFERQMAPAHPDADAPPDAAPR